MKMSIVAAEEPAIKSRKKTDSAICIFQTDAILNGR